MASRVFVALLLDALSKERNKKRRRRIKQSLLIRNNLSLINEPVKVKHDLRSFLHVKSALFQELLNLVAPHIQDRNASMRGSVDARQKLAATITYLATGCSYQELMSTSMVSPQLLSKVIPETCKAIFKCLRNYIKMPKTKEEWEEIACSFERKWNFCNCLGVYDSRHIAVEKPREDPDRYRNYKEFHSVMLEAAINANHEFAYIEVGAYGMHEGDMSMRLSNFFDKIEDGDFNIPHSAILSHTDISLPYVFLGSDSFEQSQFLLIPYSEEVTTKEAKVFNYRISRARRVAENAFGVLAARFGVFKSTTKIRLDDINSVVMACCTLHNFLAKRSPRYIPKAMLDRENVQARTFHQGDWRKYTPGLVPVSQFFDDAEWKDEGCELRSKFTDYFNTEGRVYFQDQMLNVVPL